MQFNLIDDRWIPVKLRDGTETMIAPWQVIDGFYDNPVVALNAPRPDFNGALIQFLIGLVQTVAAPDKKSEWKKLLAEPPLPDELKAKFSTVRHAFELGGEGARFMQAFEPLNDATVVGIAGLLIDAPGQNALDLNTDHFNKRGSVNNMCPACCAMALFTSQINAYGDGPGYRTSLRGGSGPLTTLIISDERHNTLWQLIWLNVLEQSIFLNLCGDPETIRPDHTFPWLASTRTSEKDTGIETTPIDVHPAQMFWSMSQRIRLVFDDNEASQCDLCDSIATSPIKRYYKKNSGVNYVGSWLHPLTPYSRKDDGTTIPAHGEKGGITYRHWLGYVQADSANNRMPARIVQEFSERQKPEWQFRLWVFGYDIYNSAKIRCWYEAKIPLLTLDNDLMKIIENETANLVTSASEVISNTKSAIKRALFSRVKEIKKNGVAVWETPSTIKEDKKELFYQIATAFWHNTEPAFYRTIYSLKQAIESGNGSLKACMEWHRDICNEADNIFKSHVLSSPIEDANPKRVVIARNELEQFNRSKGIKELLGLPVAQQSSNMAVKKRDQKQPEQKELGF